MSEINIKEPKTIPTIKRSKSSSRKRFSDNMSKEEIIWAIKKKKECNAKALEIVHEFIDPLPNADDFLKKLKHINQCHYQDVVEERAITKLCGYPLCSKMIGEMPKKQYHISLQTNKVYDITERKHFCSNACFKESSFIKEQMLTSPLWMRNQEKIPEFKLMTKPIHILPDFQKLSLSDDTISELQIKPS